MFMMVMVPVYSVFCWLGAMTSTVIVVGLFSGVRPVPLSGLNAQVPQVG